MLDSLEPIRFILPTGTPIDRAPYSTPLRGADWKSFISTKQAIYSPNDVCYTIGHVPRRGSGNESTRFITFTVPDDNWALVTCNWGCIVLCTNNDKRICEYNPEQLEVFRNGIWEDLWDYCRYRYGVSIKT